MARAATLDPIKKLQQEFDVLRQRVESLESERPGRKAKPLLAVRQRGVCAIDPDRDSETCEDASIYRYQIGCHGDACRKRQHEAYERRKDGKEDAPKEAVKVTAPRAGRKKGATVTSVSTKADKAAEAAEAKATKVPAKRISKRLAS